MSVFKRLFVWGEVGQHRDTPLLDKLFAYVQARADYLRHATAILDMVIAGKLKVHIGSTYPLAKAAEAQIALASRKTTGKLVLLP